MKKVLLTLALAAFAFAANAQLIVTGQLGFSNNGGSTYNKTVLGGTTTEATRPADIYTTITFMPAVGYKLSDKMQVGVGLGLTYNYSKEFDVVNPGFAYTAAYDKAEDWLTTSSLDFSIAPYFRYYLMEMGNFNFFCEAAISLSFNGNPAFHAFSTKIDGIHDAVDTTYAIAYHGPAVAGTTFKETQSSGSLAVSVVPGVNYKFNEKLSADLYLNVIGLGFTHTWTKNHTETVAGGVTNSTDTRVRNNRFNFFGNFSNQSINNFLGFRLALNYHF